MSNNASNDAFSSLELCLYGAGGHGRVVAKQLTARHASSPCFADQQFSIGERIDNIEVRFQAVEEITGYATLITIGDNAMRQHIQGLALRASIPLGCLIIDEARFFASPPGQGSQVLSGAIVNPGATIGKGVIVNTAAIVEHDASIGDFTHLAPGSVIGGGSSIGSNVLLGTNATILPRISVTSNCIIGAGAVVTTDIDTPGTYTGIPARCIQSTKEI